MAKRVGIGLKQASTLANMPFDERLAFISEGLPLILASAQGLWNAVIKLERGSREFDIMEGLASEEAAKVLILMDIVRCPAKLAPGRLGKLVSRFYDHLTRILYAEACDWRPVDTKDLRSYVDRERKAHCLEGYAGEYIVPNWHMYRRESQMYVDIAVYEDGSPNWSTPVSTGITSFSRPPSALVVAEAMSALGMFQVPGLKAISQVWGALEFSMDESCQDAERMTEALVTRLIAEKLPNEDATQEHVQALYRHWQLPMYGLEFAMMEVPLEDLEAERDAQLWAEAGY